MLIGSSLAARGTVLFVAALCVASACGSSDSSSGGSSGTAGKDGGGSCGNAGGATGGSGGTTGGSGGTAGGSGGTAGGSGAAGATGGSAGAGGGAGAYNCAPPTAGTVHLKLTQIATGLDYPLLVVSPPGDTTRLFVGQQSGKVVLFKNGARQPTPFLDLSGDILFGDNGGERGLLGLAFPPDYETTGAFYVHYSEVATGGDTMIARFHRDANDPDLADHATLEQVMTQVQPSLTHNGGDIQFGPDGMLYIGLGDGGGAGDNHGTIGNGQTLGTKLAKLLRLDVSTSPYSIPPGNMTGSGVAPEIWAYGLRNPYRWSFDPCTGDKYIGDVGQQKWEEVDVEPAGTPSGRNYGWRLLEGTHCYSPGTNCDPGNATTLPVAEYAHDLGLAVIGGYVYRGSAIPALRGTYLYADYASGNFWTFKYAGGAATAQADITSDINPQPIRMISTIGQDASGELYVTQLSNGNWDNDAGVLYRIDAQ